MLSEILPATAFLFLQPTYSLYLSEEVHIDAENSGYFFAVQSVVYMLFSPLFGKLQ